MKPLVSIIVPVYNTARYLDECIGSLIDQTYRNIEIVLVDDGSADNSLSICRSYGERDGRVLVIHKENGGVSSARNVGIDRSNGEYITFVDSDDKVETDYVEKLCSKVGNTQCAWFGDFSLIGIEGSVLVDFKKDQELLLELLTLGSSYTIYSKIYLAGLIRDTGLRFNEDFKTAEDALFLRQYLQGCDSIRITDGQIYHYNRNPSSITHRGHSDYANYYLLMIDELERICDKLHVSDERKRRFISERAFNAVFVTCGHFARCFKPDEAFRLSESGWERFIEKIDPDCVKGISYRNLKINTEGYLKYFIDDDFKGFFRAYSKRVRAIDFIHSLRLKLSAFLKR